MKKQPIPIYFDGKHYDAMTEREVDIPFYKRQVKKYGDPVLELGCGTGRITLPVAEESYRIIGMDISKELLKRAKEKAEEKNLQVKWIQGDMRNFSIDREFNLIYVPFNSIHHILSLEDMEKVLKNVKNHLKPRGRFIVEFFNPDLDILNRDPQEEYSAIEYEHPERDEKIEITEKVHYEKASQLMHLSWFYNFGDRTKKRKWTNRIWFPREVDAVLKYNGFEIEHKYGDFDESEFTNNSGQQILVCKRARS